MIPIHRSENWLIAIGVLSSHSPRDAKHGACYTPVQGDFPRFPASFDPVEMCELSEVSELSPQDAVESLSIKGPLGGVGSRFLKRRRG
jgi:hypothetical protein